MSKQEIRYSAALSREQAAAALEELAAALRAGTIRVTAGERGLVISPRDVIDLELEVSRKSDKGKLCIELGWRELHNADGLRFEAVDGAVASADGDDGDGGDQDEADEAASSGEGEGEGEDDPEGDDAPD